MDAVERFAPLIPGLSMLYAIPNGGERHPIVAAKMKAEGQRAGVLDYHLPVARGGYHGLYVELKSEKGDESKDQLKFAEEVREQGYMAVFCWGWEAAFDAIRDYLLQPPTVVVRPQ